MGVKRTLAIVLLVAIVAALWAQTAYAAERKVRLTVPGCV